MIQMFPSSKVMEDECSNFELGTVTWLSSVIYMTDHRSYDGAKANMIGQILRMTQNYIRQMFHAVLEDWRGYLAYYNSFLTLI